jgi:predicted CXXCH cytochrome family protein
MARRKRPSNPQAQAEPVAKAATLPPDAASEAAPPRRGRRDWRLVILPIGLVLIIAGVVAADYWSARPLDVPKTYVGRQSCIQCHSHENEQWLGSHHDLAMREPTPETVLGDFNDQTVKHHGFTSRMFRRGAKYMVETEGPDGSPTEYEIKYTFGVEPLQQYLVEFPGGRLQALPISWDTEAKKWFFLMPPGEIERITPDDPLHWTGRLMNWNHMCADCHSTDYRKNYDPKAEAFHSTYHEENVSCEACHGPGSLHVDLAESSSLFWDRNHGYGLVKLKGKENAATQIETCARCHSRRSSVYPGYVPGDELLQNYVPQLLGSHVHHVDGQLRPEEEGYVYNSFLQSKMHRKGVRCTDCHDPHTTKLKLEGNQLCAQCHQPAQFDTPLHHHHEVGTAGASCVNCHMPETTYMMVDPRRDHSIRVPRPDLSVKLGTPNACNTCHDPAKGEDAAWAAAAVEKWYGKKDRRVPHYGEAIAAALANEAGAEDALIALYRRDSGDNDVGGFVRASAIRLLGERYAGAQVEAVLKEALEDTDPLVRYAAVEAFLPRDPSRKLLVAELLDDPIRAVRIEAAHVLSEVPEERLPARYREAFQKALAEFQAGLEDQQDQPGAHFGLAWLADNRGRPGDAKSHYESALKIEPGFYPARHQLAILNERQGDLSTAERLLREGTSIGPENADAFYALALLLAQQTERQEDALAALKKAVELAPDRGRYRYNLGVMYQQLGQLEQAAGQYAAAIDLPGSTREERNEARHALYLVAQQLGQWPVALAQARQLVAEMPENPQMLHQLAVALWQSGDAAEALQQIDRALAIDPANRQLRLTREQILRSGR